MNDETDLNDRQKLDHACKLWTGIKAQRRHDRSENKLGFLYLEDAKSVGNKVLTGNTGFFRHRELYARALQLAYDLWKEKGRKVTILCAGGSVGAEPYSLAYRAVHKSKAPWFEIRTFDISSRFSAIANAAIYPASLAQGLAQNGIRDFVEPYGTRHIRVRQSFRDAVTVLPPRSFLSERLGDCEADVTISARVLMHLDTRAAERARLALGEITRHALVLDLQDTPYYKIPGFSKQPRKSIKYDVLIRNAVA